MQIEHNYFPSVGNSRKSSSGEKPLLRTSNLEKKIISWSWIPVLQVVLNFAGGFEEYSRKEV